PKPSRVLVDGGYLVGKEWTRYSLADAAERGKAFRALAGVRTDEHACRFTESWGFLHGYSHDGRTDRFPLALFHDIRRQLRALGRLLVEWSRTDRENAASAKRLADYLESCHVTVDDEKRRIQADRSVLLSDGRAASEWILELANQLHPLPP